MNVLRKDRHDENLTTADLVGNTGQRGPVREVQDDVREHQATTPRQAYSAANPTARDNPPDYIPPPSQANRGPQPVPPQASPTAPVSGAPAQRANVQTLPSGPIAGPGGGGQAMSQPPGTSGAQQPNAPTRQVIRSEQLWPPPQGQQGKRDAENTEQAGRPADQTVVGNALFPEDELHNFRARWNLVQTSFVDEPRKAVQDADSLVANIVKRIAEQFANERETLEKQWDRGADVNTEDLRQALKRYRAFFDRLLSV
jgi:hypothetical protein